MNYMAKFIAIAGFAALTACGGADTPAENVEEQADVQADAIENQAEMVDDQADMAANEMGEDALENQADALENRAAAVRESGEAGSDAMGAEERRGGKGGVSKCRLRGWP